MKIENLKHRGAKTSPVTRRHPFFHYIPCRRHILSNRLDVVLPVKPFETQRRGR